MDPGQLTPALRQAQRQLGTNRVNFTYASLRLLEAACTNLAAGPMPAWHQPGQLTKPTLNGPGQLAPALRQAQRQLGASRGNFTYASLRSSQAACTYPPPGPVPAWHQPEHSQDQISTEPGQLAATLRQAQC